MPHKIDPRWPIARVRGEVTFTRAALKADPDARDLLPHTDLWHTQVDDVQAFELKVEIDTAESDAERIVANHRLDRECEVFGDDLHLAVDKNHSSARWLSFFSATVSAFVRQALGRQIERVKAWLTVTKDAVLEKHREGLTKWVGAADTALGKTRAVGPNRGELWQKQEELADGLTRERDGLHGLLVQRANEKKLDRTWPDLFFRVETRAATDATPAPAPAPTPAK